MTPCWLPMQGLVTGDRGDCAQNTGPWESHLLWGLENILSRHCGDDGPLVCPVRLQGKGQASHQLYAQLCDGDSVIQDDNRLLGKDGVRER